ncbi:hypothetical protein [Muricoccus aerilatus]|uniref:hypothetical protein n=1 Tax=Muricoccus aerilatus TaxID=452982 RepID=UPI0012EC1809|nr:hypothetical protein [Roseomonas aerilata]
METDIDVVMGTLSPYLDRLDAILRHGHSVYETYSPEITLDHDASTQAHCTNRHALAEAHRVLDGLPNIRHIELRGQNLWLIETANTVLRFKKTDEDGVSSNYPTSQAQAFDLGDEIPGLPQQPTRVTAGYLLDATGLGYMRSQISLPTNRGAMWCAAIIPVATREADEAAWYEVTRQSRML